MQKRKKIIYGNWRIIITLSSSSTFMTNGLIFFNVVCFLNHDFRFLKLILEHEVLFFFFLWIILTCIKTIREGGQSFLPLLSWAYQQCAKGILSDGETRMLPHSLGILLMYQSVAIFCWETVSRVKYWGSHSHRFDPQGVRLCLWP